VVVVVGAAAALLDAGAGRHPGADAVRQRAGRAQRVPRGGAADRHQLLHRVAGRRRHHGRRPSHAARRLRRGLPRLPRSAGSVLYWLWRWTRDSTVASSIPGRRGQY